MKRDMDLVREIMLAVEEADGFVCTETLAEAPRFSTYSQQGIDDHAVIMEEAGLVEAIIAGHVDTEDLFIRIERLTWAGHDFIEAARDDSQWAKAKMIIRKAGGAMTLDALKGVLGQLVNAALGLG